MATYSGFQAAGIAGGLIATLGLLTPSVVIILLLVKHLKVYAQDFKFSLILKNIRPVSLALIAFGAIFIAKALIHDWLVLGITGLVFFIIHFVRLHPIIYISAGIIGGLIFA